METLKKQTNIRGDVKGTDKYSWRRYRNRQIFVETLRKQTNIGGDVKGIANIFVKSLIKQANIRGDVKERDKYWG